MADQHYRREKLSNEKINAFINRARSTFQRFRKSQPYKIGQNMVGDFGDLDLYLEDEQVEAIEHCLQEIGCDHYSGPHHPNDVACEPICKGERLLQFVWQSSYFSKRMCFKFAIDTKRPSEDRLVVVRLHPPYDPNNFSKLKGKK